MRKSWLVLVAVLVPTAASAEAPLPGPIRATVDRVIDGDTFRARAVIWIDQEIEVSVRVAGADAPELARAGCPAEKARAEKAREFTAAFLGGAAILKDIRHDKYAGRVVARVANGAGADLAEALLKSGLASHTDDHPWCPVG